MQIPRLRPRPHTADSASLGMTFVGVSRTGRRLILAGRPTAGKLYHGSVSFAAKIADFVRRHGLIAPGERVGVAVSGGADSVALLRALVELRCELGCVLAAVHFNHKIRPEAKEEAAFVRELAEKFKLQFFEAAGDAKDYAKVHRVSLETAARELRYRFFAELTSVDKIATAHTLDDQAETVLMKLIRGAGTKGVSGVWPLVSTQYPVLSTQESQRPRHGPSTRARQSSHSLGMTVRQGDAGLAEIIRPMLNVRRREVEAYLRALGQEWREDLSNRDVKHTRNKVRHELLPLLEREYNPNIYQQLADMAEVARTEEEYWAQMVRNQQPELRMELLLNQPLAFRRRLVREAFFKASGNRLDFEHTEELVRLLDLRESSRLQLPERWFAVLDWPKRVVRFEELAGTVAEKRESKLKKKEAGRGRREAGKAGPSLRSG